MKFVIKLSCLALVVLSLNSCYKYKEDNDLAVPPMFQEKHEELTKNNSGK